MIFLYAGLVFLCIISVVTGTLKKMKNDVSLLGIITANVYIFSLLIFFLGMQQHDNEFNTAIDPVDIECYTPFGGIHIITLFFYFVAFNISMVLIWRKGNTLPPLTQVLSLSFLSIGIILNFIILLQLSDHNTESIGIDESPEHVFPLLFAPLISLIIAVILVVKMVTNEMEEASQKSYSNKYLNKLNTFFAQKSNLPLWSLIMIIPLLILVTIVLLLLGQDSNSLVKVFTETTLWTFSKQTHPPILNHEGHYLCTVAASGNPKIVKPIRLGKRNGNTIIVNRQLLIANAFEEMIQDFSPKLHRFIRRNYDKYGYNLSKKINTERSSNFTYWAMKPLEWLFLVSLYLFCEKPEIKINKQYSL
ncbi:DUF6688 domain-containing protein [Flavobacterium hercynium]|uniref:Uncharacterized protein n=1 Tax=Flavobacterium hercynium TaxID=387094 RepID=A0A226GZ21_9FLAO|nr:DUF6688 family protein [Flavobacterium hercynium]OXA87299.1 hypothetical protein B0A66_16945 [Flavobacterium hercynium]SMP19783.1 hypothetical protein SAMN06265346_10673 [Flavobacterium hercynium]